MTGRPALGTAASFIHHLEDPASGRHWGVEESWAFVSDCFVASLSRADQVLAHRCAPEGLCGALFLMPCFIPYVDVMQTVKRAVSRDNFLF